MAWRCRRRFDPRSRSFSLSSTPIKACEDGSRSAMKRGQPMHVPEKSVHGRRRRGRSRCTKNEPDLVGLVTRTDSYFFDEKKKRCCHGSINIALAFAKFVPQDNNDDCGKCAHKCCLLRSVVKEAHCSRLIGSGRASIALWLPTKAAHFVQAV